MLSNQSIYSTNALHTFDHSSMSISPAVVLITTRPFVGRAILQERVEAIVGFTIYGSQQTLKKVIRGFQLKTVQITRVKHISWVGYGALEHIMHNATCIEHPVQEYATPLPTTVRSF